jgi:hypothetical protein
LIKLTRQEEEEQNTKALFCNGVYQVAAHDAMEGPPKMRYIPSAELLKKIFFGILGIEPPPNN